MNQPLSRPLTPHDLLPHRAPMLLLDEVLDHSSEGASARICLHEYSPFYDPELGGVGSWVGLEYMAQTIGLWAGFAQLSKGKPVEAGFLLGCRRYTCNSAVFPAGSTLIVKAKLVYRDDSGLGAFDCSINNDCTTYPENILAIAQIKAFLPDNPRDFVRPFSTRPPTGNPT